MKGSQILFAPYTTSDNNNKLNLQGFQKSHTEFLVKSIKTSLAEYQHLVQMIGPALAVSPIEEVNTMGAGKKKIQRAMRHSIACWNDRNTLEGTEWLAPVILEEPRILEEIGPDVGIMIFGGHSLNV